MANDDPWYWTVDRVVQELCTPNRSWTPRSASAPVPDPTILSEALLAQGISGDILLIDVDDSIMRNDLNIKVLSWRTFVRHAINELRSRSVQYQVYMQGNHAPKSMPSTEEIISRSIQGGIQGFMECQARSTQGFVPGISQIGFSHNISLATGLSGHNNADIPGGMEERSSKRRKLSSVEAIGTGAVLNESHGPFDQADNGFVTPSPEPSAPSTLEGKKRKRIAPTLITTEIDPNRNREIYTAADEYMDNHSAVLAQPESTTQTLSEPGVTFIDKEGRKRVIPILQSQLISDEPGIVSSSSKQHFGNGATGAAQSKSKSSKLVISYLGKKAMPVDHLFYDGVVTGEDLELPELSEHDTEFCQISRGVSTGQRQYVGNIMKKYLCSEMKTFSRGEESFLAIQPYSNRLIPQFQQASFTLYYRKDGNMHARRENVSKWPEINADTNSQQSTANELLATFNPLGPGIISSASYDNWDPSSLEKYRNLKGGDEVLPLYGDSDSDNEYDMTTWNEIEDEQKKKLERPLGNSRRPQFSSDEVNDAIDECVTQIVARWTAKALPKLEKKAWSLWMKSRKRNTKHEQILAAQNDLEHIEERLDRLRAKILEGVFTSLVQVQKQTVSMERTVFDQQELKWKISTLQQKRIPEKPPRSITVAAPKKPALLLANDQGLEGESLESHSDASSLEDGLDDFIVDEEVEDDTTMDEGEQDISADSEDESFAITDRRSTSSSPVPIPRVEDMATPSKPDGKRKVSGQTVFFPDEESALSVKKEKASTAQHRSSILELEASHVVIDLTLTSSDDVTPAKSKATHRRGMVIDLDTPPPKKIDFKRFRFSSLSSPLDSDDSNVEDQETQVRNTGDSQSSDDLESNAFNESDDDSENDELSNISASEQEALGDRNSRKKKKKKKKFIEDVEARDARERDQKRLAEQEARRQKLHATLASQGEHEENDGVIVNDAATEGHFYLNDFLTNRIKKHQIEGLRFLWTSAIKENKDLGGCLLAHTMGLGKTMQAISLLVSIAEASANQNPLVSSQVPERLRESKTLILCPPGLIDNWVDELLYWVNPKNILGNLFKVDAAMSLNDRLQTISRWHKKGGVLVLGYEMFRNFVINKRTGKREPQLSPELHARVIDELIKGPNIVIADEAHKMKDAKIDLTKAAMQIDTKCRIALTGSPLANNLEEYHTMIDWVSPNYLGPAREFRAKFVDPIEAGLYWDSLPQEKRKALKMLQVLKINIDPKVQRADMLVLKHDLPPKREFTITVTLTEVQKQAYRLFVQSMTKSADTALTKDGDVRQATLWQWLAILTLLCNHPSCFKAKLTERKEDAKKAALQSASTSVDVTDAESSSNPIVDVNSPLSKAGVPQDLIDRETKLFDSIQDIEDLKWSNKIKILCQILDLSRAAKDKTLVFSQSIPTLNFIENLCKRQQRKYCRLDGKTKMNTRQAQTKAFNDENDRTDVFLISTTAGGLGLNLPGANRVVIFDFKFNPIQEEQAIGRAYRIGQKKETFVYRFVVGGTFEAIVHNKTIFKSQLSSRVVDKKSVMPMAKRKAKDFLFDPTEVDQEDLSEFEGMDTLVLDKILEYQSEEKTIRAIVQSDTFEQDDNDKLTAEEEMECVAIQKQGLFSGLPIDLRGPIEQQNQSSAIKPVLHRYEKVILPPQPQKSFSPAGATVKTVTLQQPIFKPPPITPRQAPLVSDGIQVSHTPVVAGRVSKNAASTPTQSPALSHQSTSATKGERSVPNARSTPTQSPALSHRSTSAARIEKGVLTAHNPNGLRSEVSLATDRSKALESGLPSQLISGRSQSQGNSVASSAAASTSPRPVPSQTPDAFRGRKSDVRSDKQFSSRPADGRNSSVNPRRATSKSSAHKSRLSSRSSEFPSPSSVKGKSRGPKPPRKGEEPPDEQLAIQKTDMYKAMSHKPALVASLKTPVVKKVHKPSHRHLPSSSSNGKLDRDQERRKSRLQVAPSEINEQTSRPTVKGHIVPSWAREGIEKHRRKNELLRATGSDSAPPK